jgi:hypothetical protein
MEKWSLILLSLICLLFFTAVIPTVNAPLTPDSPEIHVYFNKVADVPFKPTIGFVQPYQFWRNGYGDCNDRALAFATYLHGIGVNDVHICCIYEFREGHYVIQEDGSLGHCFVVWNNQVYDPCYSPDQRYYAVNVTEYRQHLKQCTNYNLWCIDSQNEDTGTFF